MGAGIADVTGIAADCARIGRLDAGEWDPFSIQSSAAFEVALCEVWALRFPEPFLEPLPALFPIWMEQISAKHLYDPSQQSRYLSFN